MADSVAQSIRRRSSTSRGKFWTMTSAVATSERRSAAGARGSRSAETRGPYAATSSSSACDVTSSSLDRITLGGFTDASATYAFSTTATRLAFVATTRCAAPTGKYA